MPASPGRARAATGRGPPGPPREEGRVVRGSIDGHVDETVQLPRRAQRAGEGWQRLAETTAERKPTVDALPADDAFLYGDSASAETGPRLGALRGPSVSV
ncbi:hypothetical protein ACH4GM_04310 [Streptomyces coeruleorubidus]|uniref:hypothetical protein n=1 Tax=Streptomyces coeruleorubidus TaxID=116188 RepID=UPI00379119B9